MFNAKYSMALLNMSQEIMLSFIAKNVENILSETVRQKERSSQFQKLNIMIPAQSKCFLFRETGYIISLRLLNHLCGIKHDMGSRVDE